MDRFILRDEEAVRRFIEDNMLTVTMEADNGEGKITCIKAVRAVHPFEGMHPAYKKELENGRKVRRIFIFAMVEQDYFGKSMGFAHGQCTGKWSCNTRDTVDYSASSGASCPATEKGRVVK